MAATCRWAKTTVLHLGRSNPKTTYFLVGSALQSCTEVRDLGILVDDKLHFEKHVVKITRAAYMRCNHLLKFFKPKIF